MGRPSRMEISMSVILRKFFPTARESIHGQMEQYTRVIGRQGKLQAKDCYFGHREQNTMVISRGVTFMVLARLQHLMGSFTKGNGG